MEYQEQIIVDLPTKVGLSFLILGPIIGFVAVIFVVARSQMGKLKKYTIIGFSIAFIILWIYICNQPFRKFS